HTGVRAGAGRSGPPRRARHLHAGARQPQLAVERRATALLPRSGAPRFPDRCLGVLVSSNVMRRLLILAAPLLVVGCKREPTCKPESVKWEVRLAVGASNVINPNGEGTPLPTAVRIYQLRGDLAVEDLDFQTVWTSEKAEDLGEASLGVEELT